MDMPSLLLALALLAPASGADESRDREARPACSVEVRSVDASGRRRPARNVSASVAPGVILRGSLSEHGDEEAQPARLVFDVYNPSGVRYQSLLGTPVVAARQRDGQRAARGSRLREAALSVAGSSIAMTSMYGRWRVVPRIEGEKEPCGRARFFTIRP